MKKTKILMFFYSGFGFLTLAFITMKASGQMNIFDGVLKLWSDDWFKATIIDFYNNQLLIYFWIVYKEKNRFLLLIFFLFSICFGSFFSIGYVVFNLIREQNIKNLICNTKRAL
jgi:hypothetical protein